MDIICTIIDCRNGAAAPGETLDSLAVPNCDRAWETLLAESGSSDGTRRIFDRRAIGGPGLRMRVPPERPGALTLDKVGICERARRSLPFFRPEIRFGRRLGWAAEILLTSLTGPSQRLRRTERPAAARKARNA